jgi:DNA-binding response OmpR family regulator
MESSTRLQGRLVLLIDDDPATRAVVRPVLVRYGLELVQARTGVAALELLQRMPGSFRMAVISVELPGVSGAVLLETLRLFRPKLALVCLAAATSAMAEAAICLPKPVTATELRTEMEAALAGPAGHRAPVASAAAIARAEARFAASGNLLEAARELARGMPGEPASGW